MFLDEENDNDIVRNLPNVSNKIKPSANVFDTENIKFIHQKSNTTVPKKIQTLSGHLKKKSPHILQGWQVDS